MRKNRNKKLSKEEIDKIEDIVADRLANILMMQLDHEKMLKMDKKAFRLRFREVNRDIFEAIRRGQKTIETRAATVRYQKIKRGDRVILVCGKDLFEKQVADVQIFKSIDALLKKYKVRQITANTLTEEELKKFS